MGASWSGQLPAGSLHCHSVTWAADASGVSRRRIESSQRPKKLPTDWVFQYRPVFLLHKVVSEGKNNGHSSDCPLLEISGYRPPMALSVNTRSVRVALLPRNEEQQMTSPAKSALLLQGEELETNFHFLTRLHEKFLMAVPSAIPKRCHHLSARTSTYHFFNHDQDDQSRKS